MSLITGHPLCGSQCYDVWIEDNYHLINGNSIIGNEALSSGHKFFDRRNNLLLYIQMEFCFKTLKDIVLRIKKQSMTLGYYISSELFIELLECVDYLNSQKNLLLCKELCKKWHTLKDKKLLSLEPKELLDEIDIIVDYKLPQLKEKFLEVFIQTELKEKRIKYFLS